MLRMYSKAYGWHNSFIKIQISVTSIELTCLHGIVWLNGPWVSNSSTTLDTVFLNSSAECKRPVRNFSCKEINTFSDGLHEQVIYLVFLQHGVTINETLLEGDPG